MVQGIGTKLHGAGYNDLCGDGIEDIPVLENDETSDIRDYLTLAKLLAHVYLYVRQPHFRNEVCRAHKISC